MKSAAGSRLSPNALIVLLAYRLGCKGITAFRASSRVKQVLTCSDVGVC